MIDLVTINHLGTHAVTITAPRLRFNRAAFDRALAYGDELGLSIHTLTRGI
jgi:hypothetical protein